MVLEPPLEFGTRLAVDYTNEATKWLILKGFGVMGGMAEKISLLVDGGIEYYEGKVMVTDASDNGMGAVPMSTDRIADLEAVEGVEAASASLTMLLDEELGNVTVGIPPLILGTDFRAEGLEDFELSYQEGRGLRENDKQVAVVGADLVEKTGAVLGEKITVRGEEFEVVGITEKTLTAPDSQVTIPMMDAQRLYIETLPAALRDSVDEKTLASQIAVYPKDGVDADELATRINNEVEGVSAAGPTGFQERIVQSTQLITSIVYGIALISLLVGGLSVINTMTMAVAERTREIGVRKAIGATDGAIMRQFVAESGVIGLTGGLLGLAAGGAITYALNAAGNDSGTMLFLVTGRLALGSVVFATVLGVLSGLYPAWHAARLNPVQALRAE